MSEGARRRDRRLLEFRRSGKRKKKRERKETRCKEGIGGREKEKKNKIKERIHSQVAARRVLFPEGGEFLICAE